MSAQHGLALRIALIVAIVLLAAAVGAGWKWHKATPEAGWSWIDDGVAPTYVDDGAAA